MPHPVKQLLPSLILIVIYFIVDELFSPAISVPCVILLGIIEFIYTRIREKVYDKMILFTTLFFCIPGAIALFAEDTLLSSLQGVMVESALCILLGFFAFSHSDLTATLPAGYRKNMTLTSTQQKNMRQTFKWLFFILCVHTLLATGAILFCPAPTASFIGGSLLYIIIICFFITIFIRNKIIMQRMKKEEWLPIVNEKGEVTGQAPRSICHSGSKLLHPVVHLHIVNEKHEFFLQKRSMKKDLLPGKWDTAVGGHIGLNEKVEEALKRETFEELGITDFEARFIGNYVWESPREKELVFSFLCTRYDHIIIDNDEVDEGKFWSKQEIENGVSQDLLTPNFAHEYDQFLKKL